MSRLDDELSQSRLGCGVVVGLAVVVAAVAGVVAAVGSLCCGDDDGMVDVTFFGGPYDAFAVFDEHGVDVLVEVLEPAGSEDTWHLWHFEDDPDAAVFGVASIKSLATAVVVVGNSRRARLELPAGKYAVCVIADDRAIDSYFDRCFSREIREEDTVIHRRFPVEE